ncbi:MAG: GTPase Era [Spirochaetales bacterium]|nr:GTPase Era [Spirochaetales bacterium]
MKFAFVSLVGRPSSGKSTFINRICQRKVSIVSPVPQTTRNKIRGIYNADEGAGQLVFIDTPGFHSSKKKFNIYMKKLVHSSIEESDMVLYLIDISRDTGEEEREIMRIIGKTEKPVIVGLNKIDITHNYRQSIVSDLEQMLPDLSFYDISAATGGGLQKLLEALFETAPEGEAMYPEEFYTDQPPDFRIAEIIREAAIAETKQELPHCLFVDIQDMEMREEKNMLWVRGFICVERESQKGILIGKNGEKIRKILETSREELKDLFPYYIHLDFRVKVSPKWRNKDLIIKRLTE